MNTLFRCLVIGSALLFLGLSGDPNEKADELYAQAVQLVESAKQASSYSEALPLYERAGDMLERIVSQHADSTIAGDLISGQTKISNLTLSEFRELEGSLKRYAKAEQDPLSCALVVARTVQREYLRIEAAIDIARVFVKAGQAKQVTVALSQALDLANAIHAVEDEYTKARALVDIANEFIELGQPEQAGPLLSQALDVANTYPRWEEASWAECEHEGEFICGDFEPRSATVSLFVDIAGGLTKAGQTERAESLLLQAFNLSDGIGWSFIKGRNLAEIVTGLVEAGRFTQVLPVANAVRGENGTSTVVAAIAEALARVGQTELGGPLLSRALEMAQVYRNKYKWDTVSCFVAIAGGLTKAGQTEQAEQVFSQALDLAVAIKDKATKATALRVIAGGLTEAGQTERARNIANTIKDESGKVWALVTIANELTKAGQTEQAEQVFSQALDLANTLKDERAKAWVLVDIAKGLTEVGQTERVHNVANTIKNKNRQADALVTVAKGLTKAGQIKQAEQVLSQALDLANILKNESKEDWVSVTNEDEKDRVLREIASGFAKAGQFTQSLAVTKTIKDGYWPGYEQKYRKALALADITSGFVKTGHQPSESDVAILREIVQTAMPVEKAWERIKKNNPARGTNAEG